MESDKVVIIGAGLSGLTCARTLQEQGIDFLLLEAKDHIGGRVTSDVVDGFVLDRGFQVILDSYPEAQRALNFKELGHQGFSPGALVRHRGKFWRVVDPWRSLLQGIASIKAPFLSLSDGIKLVQLRGFCLRSKAEKDSQSTNDFLIGRGFSEGIMDSFFRPFFRGVTLDPELKIPAWYFQSLFGWFAKGSAGLPKEGMKAISEQLAKDFPEGSIRLSESVESINGTNIKLSSGETIKSRAVVVATDFDNAGKLTDTDKSGTWFGTTTLYFAADKSPVGEAILVLDGDKESCGPVNHLCVLSDAQSSYAPYGKSLISATIVGIPVESDADVEASVTTQMREWYGDQVDSWQLLRIDRVKEALPVSGSGDHKATMPAGVFRCGDYLISPSIQGAMGSGRTTAEAVASWLE
ncbi:MAG: phytoene dehydrogenase-like protein [Planctomycetota bacterium]